MWDLRRIANIRPIGTIGEGSDGGASETGHSKAVGKGRKEDDITDPFGLMRAHYTQDIPKGKTVREVGFSRNGEYMVGVGDGGMVAIFKRW